MTFRRPRAVLACALSGALALPAAAEDPVFGPADMPDIYRQPPGPKDPSLTTDLPPPLRMTEAQLYAIPKGGNRVEDAGPAPGIWAVYPSDDLLVQAADACLGFFMTRNDPALGGFGFDHPNASAQDYPVLGDYEARLHIFNYPFNKFGVFRCEPTYWPEIPAGPATIEALRAWMADRLAPEDGWTVVSGSDDGTLDWVEVRNAAYGVTFRTVALEGLTFTLTADYFGPPIIIIEDGY